MSTLTAQQLIEQTHVWLMNNKLTMAYASVLMVGETKVAEELPGGGMLTAYTDGRDVTYGREFVLSLTKPELRAVVLHENLHKVYQHGWMWKELFLENPDRANRAADYVINLEIDRIEKASNGEVKLPAMVLLDPAYTGMTTYQVYNLLEKNGGKGDKGGTGKCLDQHNFGKLSPEEAKAAAEEIDHALRQGALATSKLGGAVSRELIALMEPVVNWKEQLREFMLSIGTGRDDATWRRPNRRYIQYGMYMPSSISTTMGRIVFGGDTSGSIGDADIAVAVSELASVCEAVRPESIDVIWWDDAVRGHEVYQREDLENIAHRTRPKGGMGTSAQCVSQYLRKNNIKPECVIMLSDGYIPSGEWGEWDCPVLWVLTTKGITAPSGSTIYLEW